MSKTKTNRAGVVCAHFERQSKSTRIGPHANCPNWNGLIDFIQPNETLVAENVLTNQRRKSLSFDLRVRKKV